MRKIATLGSVLLLSSASLVGGAAPASASDLCSHPTWGIVCDAAGRQVQHVQEELGQVPGYVDQVRDTALSLYDTATATVRCVISGECT